MSAGDRSAARPADPRDLYLEDLRRLVGHRKGGAGSGESARRSQLVESSLFFVVKLARDYSSLGVPFEDLLSEGNVGLLEAASRFDPDRGVAFITYASWWIRKRMLNLMARQSTVIRLPKYKLERLRRLRTAEAALRGRLGRPPSEEDLVEETGLPGREIRNLRVLGQREVSLEHVLNPESGRRVADTLPAETSARTHEDVIEKDYGAFIGQIVDALPEKERFVVRHRFGFETSRPETLQRIADRLGLSRERVRQLEIQALRRLRRALATAAPDGRTDPAAAGRL